MKNYVLMLAIFLFLLSCITINTPTPSPTQQNQNLEPTASALPSQEVLVNPSLTQSLEARINLHGEVSWNWQKIDAPTIKPVTLKSPLTILDNRGYLHLLWDTPASSGDAFIYHSYYNGSAWTPPAPIALTLGVSDIRSVSFVSANDGIHLLWYNTLQFGGPFRLMYAHFDGEKWSQESEIMRVEKDPNLSGALLVDEKGVHAIVETPNITSADINYLSLQGSNWSAPEIITPSVGLFSWNYSPNRNGMVRFYGKNAFNNNLTFAYWQNGQTEVKNTDIVLPLHFDTFFVTAQGDYFNYWTASASVPGGMIEGAYYQCIDGNLAAFPAQILSGETAVVTKPIVAQSASKTAMLWADKEQQIRLLLPKSCAEADLFTLPLPPLEKMERKPLAVAFSDTPNKICVVSKVGYSNTPLEIYCAETP